MTVKMEVILLTALLSCSYTTSIKIYNATVTDTTEFVDITNTDGEVVLMPVELIKTREESKTLQAFPLQRITEVQNDTVKEELCYVGANSIDSFPDSGFTDEQLKQGAFLLFVAFAIYSFTLLAVVCSEYYIPCIEMICEDLKISQNVAAATFMAFATACPEFFVNVISTFLTESDMGIGAIVGSAMFNMLGVAAIGGLAAITPIKIDSRPVTRDVLIYMVVVSVLVTFVWDGRVDWYESAILAILCILYFFLMFNSTRLFGFIDKILYCGVTNGTGKSNSVVNETNVSIERGYHNKGFEDINVVKGFSNKPKKSVVSVIEIIEEQPQKLPKSIWRFPRENSLPFRIWWVYSWPLRIILGMMIPNPYIYRRFYPFAFIMCLVCIGVNSYVVSWSVTVIGHTFSIPDTVMGMTFLGFGGCLLETCSIFFMSRRGEGGIGVSNALGSNSLAILFSLGVPWLVRSLKLIIQGDEETAVIINSSGIDNVVASLLVAVCSVWLTLYFGKFTLRKIIGFVFASLYLAFISFGILVEMGYIFDHSLKCV